MHGRGKGEVFVCELEESSRMRETLTLMHVRLVNNKRTKQRWKLQAGGCKLEVKPVDRLS
jgi:hypothetical protein